jgi:methylenetetrahydrofolate reductase (NADPH)
VSRLADALGGSGRVLTAELPPIDTADAHAVRAAIEAYAPFVDALNVVDNSAARAHACALSVAAVAAKAGVEPVMHLTCRDRNRLALQADLVGASLLQIENILCMTGDDVSAGDEPQSKRVFDLDGPQLIALAAGISNGRYLSGRKLGSPPALFIGAVENPTAPPVEHRADRALKKALAGARFFQLQAVFEVAPVLGFAERAKTNGLLGRASLLATICVPGGARGLRWLRDRVPGVVVPDHVIGAVERLPSSQQRGACYEAAVALGERLLADVPSLRGLHVCSFQGPAVVETLRELVARTDPVRPHLPSQPAGNRADTWIVLSDGGYGEA